MIVVTGAAGFIGSCITSQLNILGIQDLLLVDHFENEGDAKSNNLSGKKYIKFIDKNDFLRLVLNDQLDSDIKAIIHMGACSSTTLQDAQYFKENNLEYTQHLARWSLKKNVRFIYASSAATYGDGSVGYKDDEDTIKKCQPLNLYGASKQDFDRWALDNGLLNRMVGLKFFNVFGPNEYHKDDMRSVVAKSYQSVVKEGRIKLFKSYKPEYKDGEQKRDFIYVKDAVNVVLYFLNNPKINGIFNVGTGVARTWNDLANALFKVVGKPTQIEYFDMPESLRPRYQYFTQAEMSKLRQTGYTQNFMSLEDSVADYAKYLKTHSYF